MFTIVLPCTKTGGGEKTEKFGYYATRLTQPPRKKLCNQDKLNSANKLG